MILDNILLCSLGYLNSSIILQVFSLTISLHCNRKFMVLFEKFNLKQKNTPTSSIYFKSIIHINKQTLKCVTIFYIKRIHNHSAISNNICHLLLHITPQSTKIFTLFQKFQMDFLKWCVMWATFQYINTSKQMILWIIGTNATACY